MKILASAYSCLKDPDRRFGDGGEGFLGWNMVSQLGRFGEVWVLTHFKNQKSIEKKLEQNLVPCVKFYYIGLPAWVEFFNKFHGGIQLCAYFWQIKAYFVAKKMNKEIHFDVFHHITYANDWMASFIGALLPVPYIRGPGGGAHRIPKNFLKEYSLKEKMLDRVRSFGQWVFRHDPFFIIGQNNAKAILVCNKESFDAMPGKWQEKAYFFPVNGVSKSDFQILNKKIKKEEEIFSVITAGKLIKIKNFDLAIRAFKIFSDKISDSQLTVVGTGPEFLNLKNLSERLEIAGKVKFEKWMAREELLLKIASADIFIFPSLRDGGGAVVVEAMAMEKPVVCFDAAGPGLHVDENSGIKIKTDNPEQAVEDFAKALGKLYFDKDLRIKLGIGARQKAEKEYCWDKLGDKLNKIYRKIL